VSVGRAAEQECRSFGSGTACDDEDAPEPRKLIREPRFFQLHRA